MSLLPLRPIGLLLALLVAVLFSSCSITQQQEEDVPLSPRGVDKSGGKYANPFPAGTYQHFVASKSYPQTYKTFRDGSLLKSSTSGTRRIIICLDEQRGRLYTGEKVALDFPISTGVRAYPTYTGSYRVIGKSESHSSNLYGKMYNAEGKCVNYNAESSDPVPEGGRYVGASMPYWQRLTNAGLGLHVGKVRRRPQSHGCIRLQPATGKELYKQTQIGTPVIIRQNPESVKNPFAAPPEQKRKPVVPKSPTVKRNPVNSSSSTTEETVKSIEILDKPMGKAPEPGASSVDFTDKVQDKTEAGSTSPAESVN